MLSLCSDLCQNGSTLTESVRVCFVMIQEERDSKELYTRVYGNEHHLSESFQRLL